MRLRCQKALSIPTADAGISQHKLLALQLLISSAGGSTQEKGIPTLSKPSQARMFNP